MSVSARDALEYATRDEFLKLYAVLALGYVLTIFSTSFAGTAVTAFGFLLVSLVALAGLLAMLVAAVGVLHKIIAES
ncbi:hypothetical protein [Halorussus pelagicus]|uniref:hypothetical protein n=1 Tax=Halorussus pelagicus TaxID=2505977 RepID=UPI000FFBDAC4|nr:hypothetical protein [Halorussus pelagicus]